MSRIYIKYDKNESQLCSDKILICSECKSFILIKKISLNFTNVYILYQCKCNDKFKWMTLNKCLQNKIYSFKHLIIKNNYFYILEKNTWQKLNNNYQCFTDINTEKEYNCNCINFHKLYYCIDCQKIICNECIKSHNYHRLFNYEQDIHMSNKKVNQLAKYCYNSYIKLKQCNATAKSKIKEIKKKNINKKKRKSNDIDVYMQYHNQIKNIDIIDDYINYNNKINDSLYELFQLLINTFKAARTFQNYLNLSHFANCNIPFQFELFEIERYKNEPKIDLIQLFIYYCKSNFLIPIQSRQKCFSFMKELAFHIRLIVRIPKRNESKALILKKMTINIGEKTKEKKTIFRKHFKHKNLTITHLIPFDNDLLVIEFVSPIIVSVVSFNVNKKSISFKYRITGREGLFRNIIKFSNSILIGMNRIIEVMLIKENNYETIATYTCCNYCIKLSDQRALLLSHFGFYLVEKVTESSEKILIDDNDLEFDSGFGLSNGLVLLHKKMRLRLIKIIEWLKTSVKVIVSFKNPLFTELITCSENEDKKLLFCQNKTHIIIVNLTTNKIQSIYETCNFLFYPLNHTKDELMTTLFNDYNYDNKKLLKLMLFGENKTIFQISPNYFIISTAKTVYWYQLN